MYKINVIGCSLGGRGSQLSLFRPKAFMSPAPVVWNCINGVVANQLRAPAMRKLGLSSHPLQLRASLHLWFCRCGDDRLTGLVSRYRDVCGRDRLAIARKGVFTFVSIRMCCAAPAHLPIFFHRSMDGERNIAFDRIQFNSLYPRLVRRIWPRQPATKQLAFFDTNGLSPNIEDVFKKFNRLMGNEKLQIELLPNHFDQRGTRKCRPW